ncbi:glycosyl hydrolase family 8 [Yersinia bercovieri]|uniref:glycosyl hydrolase family 8 n=1 Tax=Yersinia bercovieri TaxID=634 RepID=UPI0011AB35EE|nr:glycosyl hydrolase family 8 [Yersinia bercovieri]
MLIKRTTRLVFTIGVLFGLLFSAAVQAQDPGWEQFKSRFLKSDGRIVDSGNHDVSHTEGQGFGMLLAVFNDDKPTFDALLGWTNRTLYNEDAGLFSWRYEPNAKVKVADKNNATDGDLLIAWALLLAGDKWKNNDYIAQSNQIQSAIIKHTVISFAGYHIMLPGANSFNHTSYVVVNPSYYIFPAWQAFYQYSHLKIWQDLNNDAIKQLSAMKLGKVNLPTDWVALQSDGSFAPANGWPARFSFDAIRIPLYLSWGENNNSALAPFIRYWQGFARLTTPAWVNVVTGATAEYPLTPGMLAIRDLTFGNLGQLTTTLLPEEDYYSSCLRLLSWWAAKQQ